jgi:hypothetical protein
MTEPRIRITMAPKEPDPHEIQVIRDTFAAAGFPEIVVAGYDRSYTLSGPSIPDGAIGVFIPPVTMSLPDIIYLSTPIALFLSQFAMGAAKAAGEDTYKTFKTFIRKLLTKPSGSTEHPKMRESLELTDPESGASIKFEKDLPEKAYRDCFGLDLSKVGNERLSYDRSRDEWVLSAPKRNPNRYRATFPEPSVRRRPPSKARRSNSVASAPSRAHTFFEHSDEARQLGGDDGPL